MKHLLKCGEGDTWKYCVQCTEENVWCFQCCTCTGLIAFFKYWKRMYVVATCWHLALFYNLLMFTNVIGNCTDRQYVLKTNKAILIYSVILYASIYEFTKWFLNVKYVVLMHK